MHTNRLHTALRRLAFPLAGAAVALAASGATAQPIFEDGPQLPPNAAPTAKAKATPKIALKSNLLVIGQKGPKVEGLADLQGGDVVKLNAAGSSDPDGDNLSFDWDLDGNGSYEVLDGDAQQSKRFYEAGTFNIKVRVKDGNGGMASDIEQVIVHAAPRAKLNASLTTPLIGQTVNYDATGSTADPSIAKHEWDLDGDGIFETDTGASSETSTSFAAPGTRPVRLRITDTYGVESVATLMTKVNGLPTAAFTNSAAVAGSPVQLDGSASTDDNAISSYAWDLDGDGSYETDSGAAPTASTTFETAGTATVRLRVTDDLGASAVVARQIVVAPKLPVAQPSGQTGTPSGNGNGASGGAGGTPQADRLAPTLKLSAKTLKLAKNGKVTLKLTCPAGETTCKGTVKLRAAKGSKKTLGSAKFTIAGGKSASVRVLIPAANRKAIRRGSKLNVKAIIAVADAAGNQGTATKSILIGL